MQVRKTEHLTTPNSKIKRHHQPVLQGPRGAAIGEQAAEVSPFLLALGMAFQQSTTPGIPLLIPVSKGCASNRQREQGRCQQDASCSAESDH